MKAAQIAVDVALELPAVDDDRLGVGLRLLLRGRRAGGIGRADEIGIVGIDVVDHQGEALAVRRPGELGDVGLVVGQPHRLAAGAVEQPDLHLLALARREEGEVAAVRAPARRALPLRRSGQPVRLAAGERHHPDVAVLGVLLGVQARHGERHQAAVRAHPRIADRLELVDVVGGEQALPGAGGKGAKRRTGCGERQGRGGEDEAGSRGHGHLLERAERW